MLSVHLLPKTIKWLKYLCSQFRNNGCQWRSCTFGHINIVWGEIFFSFFLSDYTIIMINIYLMHQNSHYDTHFILSSKSLNADRKNNWDNKMYMFENKLFVRASVIVSVHLRMCINGLSNYFSLSPNYSHLPLIRTRYFNQQFPVASAKSFISLFRVAQLRHTTHVRAHIQTYKHTHIHARNDYSSQFDYHSLLAMYFHCWLSLFP